MSSGIDGVGGASAASQASAATAATTGSLDKNQFLELLVAQLRNQDPLNPVGSQEFMSQMAAFSTLEQVTNLAVTGEQQNSMTAANQAVALVGHKVTYEKADETTAKGTVESVEFGEEGLSLTINGEAGVLPGAVTEVR